MGNSKTKKPSKRLASKLGLDEAIDEVPNQSLLNKLGFSNEPDVIDTNVNPGL